MYWKSLGQASGQLNKIMCMCSSAVGQLLELLQIEIQHHNGMYQRLNLLQYTFAFQVNFIFVNWVISIHSACVAARSQQGKPERHMPQDHPYWAIVWAWWFVFVSLLSQSLFSSVILNATRLETFSPFQRIALWGQSTSLWQHITIIQRNAHYREIVCPLQKYGYQRRRQSEFPAPRILVLHPLLLCTKCYEVSHAKYILTYHSKCYTRSDMRNAFRRIAVNVTHV